jgi:D-xylose transport system substrate-binding protein
MRAQIIINFIKCFLIAIVFSSCNNQKQKIGILIASDVFQSDLDNLTQLLQSQNIEVISANARLDAGKQVEQANEIIEKDVDAMMIIPVNTYTAAEIVRNCNAHDIKTIAYERLISNCNLDYYISFDNEHVGELMAQNAIKTMPKGKYVIFNGDKTDRNALRVNEGMMKVLAPYIQSGAIEILYQTFIEGWTQDNAKYEFEEYYNSTMPIPDVVLSAQNKLSNGIISVLEQHNIPQYPVITGQNTDIPEARQAWHPKQQIVVFKSNKVESKAAADLAVKVLRNEKISISQHLNNGLIDVPTIFVKEMSLETH